MNTQKAKVMDVMDGIFIDLFTEDLKEIQEAVYRYGGTIIVYEIIDAFRISYTLNSGPFSMMIYGIHISQEQYDLQVNAFGGQVKQFEKGTKLVLIDNLYFLEHESGN
jgi:hypothetical protein